MNLGHFSRDQFRNHGDWQIAMRMQTVARIATPMGLLWLLTLGIVATGGGCRTPWRSSTAEPSFDRLIEIEQQSQHRATKRGPLGSRPRPGQDSLPPGMKNAPSSGGQADVLPAAANALLGDRGAVGRGKNISNSASLAGGEGAAEQEEGDPSQMDELLVDVPPAQRELLRREMSALHARSRAKGEMDDEVPVPRTPLNSVAANDSNRQNLPAHRRISDQSDLEADSSVAAHEVDSADTNDLESSDNDSEQEDYTGSSKYPLATNQSNRQARGTSPKPLSGKENYSRQLSDHPSAGPSLAKNSIKKPQRSSIEADGVVAAGHTSAILPNDTPSASEAASSPPEDSLDWRQHIAAALAQLEEQPTTASPEEKVHQQMVDRLLHLSLGDIEAASEPIEGLQANGQDFIRHSLKSLYEVTNPAGNPVEMKRYTLAMLSQRQALSHLAAVSNLEVHNATFCTEVDSFGVVTKFPQYAFKPDQEVLLYCELDNFASTHIDGKGYETQLQGSYQIVDSSGKRVADQLLPMDSHQCRNQRRDYFIAYRIYMPTKIASGKYQLNLTVEDMKGRKFGQASLDFQIQ